MILLFEICGFKNCKIGSEVVNISMGHPVYTVDTRVHPNKKWLEITR